MKFFTRDKYPHMSRGTWISRTWILIRKVIQQDGTPTVNDVRVARILLHHSGRVARCPNHLKLMLEEVIINGYATSDPCVCVSDPTEEGLGEAPGSLTWRRSNRNGG